MAKQPLTRPNSTLIANKLKSEIQSLEYKILYSKEMIKHLPDAIKKETELWKKAEMKIKLLETEQVVILLERHLKDKINHFENDFLPKHTAEMKECEENFEKYLKKAKEFASKTENKDYQITLAMNQYFLLNPDNKDEELKLGFYQGMKSFFDNYEKKTPMRVVN
jgi:hypothetical protein